MSPTVLLIGTLDTKGDEYAFLRDRLNDAGVDVLLARGADPERILMVGAVAGGGDPAGVAAALDPRITAVAPFNFGGVQPDYATPPDAASSASAFSSAKRAQRAANSSSDSPGRPYSFSSRLTGRSSRWLRVRWSTRSRSTRFQNAVCATGASVSR